MKVKATERKLGFVKNSDGEPEYAYVMQPVLYGQLSEDKVIEEAALRTGMNKAAMTAAYAGLSEVISSWTTEGHSVAVPGLGVLRFGLRAKSVKDVSQVGAELINCRHVIFTPNSKLKKKLADASINITCIDRNGKVVKQVKASDKDDVSDSSDPKDNTGSGSGNTPGSSDSGDGTVE